MIFWLLFALLQGCSPKPNIIKPDQNDYFPESYIVKQAGTDILSEKSRLLASHSLTREGYLLLEKGNIDSAISILERAVGINPSDGPGYFYLAEAWYKRGNYNLAFQFNKLAIMYLRENSFWSNSAETQHNKIREQLGFEN